MVVAGCASVAGVHWKGGHILTLGLMVAGCASVAGVHWKGDHIPALGLMVTVPL